MEPQRTNQLPLPPPPVEPPALTNDTAPQEEKGAIGIALLVWLLGGGLGLAVLVFVLLKAC